MILKRINASTKNDFITIIIVDAKKFTITAPENDNWKIDVVFTDERDNTVTVNLEKLEKFSPNGFKNMFDDELFWKKLHKASEDIKGNPYMFSVHFTDIAVELLDISKTGSRFFSYDVLRSLYDKNISSNFRNFGVVGITIEYEYEDDNFVTLSCTSSNRLTSLFDIDESYEIDFEELTFNEFLNRVRKTEEIFLDEVDTLVMDCREQTAKIEKAHNQMLEEN